MLCPCADGVVERPQQAGLQPVCPRPDFPVNRPGGAASLQAALSAATTSNQRASLEALQIDMLAPSTRPSVLSRVATWQTICAAWSVPPFPMTLDNIRKAAASFKQGRYRSAKQYFSVVSAYQLREFGIELPSALRGTIRDVCRSIERGQGPAKLKDAFFLPQLQQLVALDDSTAFAVENPQHSVDVVILGCWFMLREIELAQAEVHHLQADDRAVTLAIPFHKTDSRGSMCQRTLECACLGQVSLLCPVHAAQRHLRRLRAAEGFRGDRSPLVPAADWAVASKTQTIDMIRSTLAACGPLKTRRNLWTVKSQQAAAHPSGREFRQWLQPTLNPLGTFRDSTWPWSTICVL